MQIGDNLRGPVRYLKQVEVVPFQLMRAGIFCGFRGSDRNTRVSFEYKDLNPHCTFVIGCMQGYMCLSAKDGGQGGAWTV